MLLFEFVKFTIEYWIYCYTENNEAFTKIVKPTVLEQGVQALGKEIA